MRACLFFPREEQGKEVIFMLACSRVKYVQLGEWPSPAPASSSPPPCMNTRRLATSSSYRFAMRSTNPSSSCCSPAGEASAAAAGPAAGGSGYGGGSHVGDAWGRWEAWPAHLSLRRCRHSCDVPSFLVLACSVLPHFLHFAVSELLSRSIL